LRHATDELAGGMRREWMGPMQRILVALDASPNASAVLDAGIDLARQSASRLLLLRVVAMPPEPLLANGFASPPTELVDSFITTAKHDLADLAQRVPDGMLEGATAQVGVAWEAICSHAREHDVDLIVIGSHDYRLIDRILGTTAAKVVNHADRPVLVVRPKHGAAPRGVGQKRPEKPSDALRGVADGVRATALPLGAVK
jgi:nucleotide-binding universal stress UspA family protein